MMKHTLLLLFACLTSVLTAVAQQRDKQLHIVVTTEVGENLEGVSVNLTQTDFSLDYGTLRLDANGTCDVKVYAGNHNLTVAHAGFNTVSKDFNVPEDGTGTTVSVNLTEETHDPYALTATLVHNAYTGENNVVLGWNQEAPVFFDDFESYNPFAIEFGNWTGIDGDEIAAAALQGDYSNRGVKQYAQIINPLVVEPAWWYEYPVLRPYSGKQYVGFTRTSNGAANDDWLVSPTIKVGTDNILSFMAKAADMYNEPFMVYITTQTNNPAKEDFVRLDKGNYESVDYTRWQKFSYDLSEYAGKEIKFAIRYIANAGLTGAFMLMVDDVFVGQPPVDKALAAAKRMVMRSPKNPNETFDIYQNGTKIGNTDGYNYTINNVAYGNHTFGVQAKYKASVSNIITVDASISADDYVKVEFNVSADSKCTVDGQVINLTNTDSGEDYSVTVADGKAAIVALPKGTYMVNITEEAFNEYEQTLVADADKILNITLTDHIIDPYNITADITKDDAGTYSVDLKWNQELLFKDSFEEYDDFATGSFGEWTSVDNDKMSVYPISLNGYIINFPGASTTSQPAAIAPMVFNPLSTIPAMYPTDQAVKAPTGDKTVIFFSPQQGQADKWLISTEITVREGYSLKVTAKSYTDMYPETIEFCISTDGTSTDDFKVLSKAERMPSDQWTQYSVPLAGYEGQTVHLAVHYTSYDTFFAQIDDFIVGPENGGNTFIDYGNVDHYVIYLDGKEIAQSQTSSFVLESISEGDHIIGIQAIYKKGESAITYYTLAVTGINSVTAGKFPAAVYYTLDGLYAGSSFDKLRKGIYIQKTGDKVYKIRK